MITQSSARAKSSRKVPSAIIAAILFASTIFSVTLVACGSSGKASTSQPTRSPTSTLPVYTGKGFTISYPKGWTTNSIDNTYGFSSPVPNPAKDRPLLLTIGTVSDPYGLVDAPTLISKAYQGYQNPGWEHIHAVNVPSTVMIGGDSWSQKAFIGTQVLVNGQNPGPLEITILADTHPANAASTQAFTMEYSVKQSSFATAYTNYFLPMLQSLRFTS